MTAIGSISSPVDPLSPRQSVVKDECFFVSATNVHDGGVIQVAGGAGAATTTPGTIEAGHPGIIWFTTGTTTTGRCAFWSASAPISLGNGAVEFGAVVRLPILSDGTETYTVRLGFGDGVAGTDFVDALGFRYSHGVNGGKWELVAVSASVEVVADSGVAVDTLWHTLKCVVDATAATAVFSIDGVVVGTIASGVPTAGSGIIPALIRKSVGTTARLLYLDAYWYRFDVPGR